MTNRTSESPAATTPSREPPKVYVDRATGATFADAFAMVNAYLARYNERAGDAREAVRPLDERGYTVAREGSAQVAINVLDDHGVLLLLARVMSVPKTGREALYRRLLELSFLETGDASFAIDAARDEVYVRAVRPLSGLDYEELERLLGTVGRTADAWDDNLRRELRTGG